MSTKIRPSHIKFVLVIVLCIIWVLACFWITKDVMFDGTSSLTVENTHQMTVAPNDIEFEIVEIGKPAGRDIERLLMDIGDDHFFVDWWIGGKEGTQRGEVFEILPELEGETSLTLTIFEDAFFVGKRCKVVDVRSPTTVYYDICYENDRQKKDRTIVLWVVWIPILICCGGVYLFCEKLLPREYRVGFFKKIKDLLETPIGEIGNKEKTIVPPKNPTK